MTISPTVVAIGECMIELCGIDTPPLLLKAGGDTCNTAIYMTRLGMEVAYMTALGADPFSTKMRLDWETEGLDTTLVLTDPARLPGQYAIRTDDDGERRFFYWRRTSAARRLFTLEGIDAMLERAAQARLLYLTGITLSLFDRAGRSRLLDLACQVRSNGGDVAFDSNYRPQNWSHVRTARKAIEDFAGIVTIALPTRDDECLLHGKCDSDATIRRWQDFGAREVIVQLGAEGC